MLHTIADAANRDGDEAHPGIGAMIDGSLYSKSQVLKTVAELEAAGWILTTAKAAPGRNTTFRIVPMFDEINGSQSENDGSHSGGNGSQPAPTAPTTASNGLNNGGARAGAHTSNRRSKGTPAPDSFEVTDTLRAWAKTNRVTCDLQATTEQFLDHHRAKGSVLKDWTAAWRTWMRNTRRWGGVENLDRPPAEVAPEVGW